LSFAKNVINSFLSRSAILVFTFLSGMLSARILGPTDKGILTILFLVSQLAFALGNLGIGVANVYLIGQKEFRLSDIASNSLFVSMFFGSIGIVVSYIAIKFAFFSTFRGATDKQIVAALAAIPARYLLLYGSTILVGTLNIKRYNIAFLAEALALFCLFICSLVLLRKGLYGAIVSQTLSTFIASVLCLFFVLKIAQVKLAFNRRLLRRSISFGFGGYILSSVRFFNLRLGLFLVSYYLGAKRVGIYSIAVSIAALVLYIPESVRLTLYPTVASSSSGKMSSYLTTRVCRQVLLATILSSILLFAGARLGIPTFCGPEFMPSIRPLKILLPGVICLGVSRLLCSDLAGRGKPMISGYSGLAGLMVTILADITLIPRLGVQGAALASTLSYFVMSIIPICFFVKYTKRKVQDLLIFKLRDWQDYKTALCTIIKR
jgi:O-antigen/teichoic acid export membrane protein